MQEETIEKVKERVEPISLLNHTVAVSDPYILQFFYPNLSIINSPKEYHPNMNNVIYTGDYKLIATFNQNDITYIATGAPVSEYDLTDKTELIKFVYSKYHKNPPKYLMDHSVVESMSYEECLMYCKMFWVSGSWFGVKEEVVSKNFDFLLSLNKDASLTVFNNFFSLDSDITTFILNFLFNIVSNTGTKNPRYNELLVKARSSYSNKIKPAVNRYVRSNVTNLQLRNFYLIFDLIS